MQTILLVEDDDSLAYALDQRLRQASFAVVRAADSLEALRHLDSDRPFDLLLADIRMPEGQPHGIALSLMARVRRPRLAVIFMSGYPGLIKEGRVDDLVFEKPFNPGALVAAIQSRLGLDARGAPTRI